MIATTKNQKRAVRNLQEYPGACVWTDYESLCPNCGRWTEDYGEVDTKIGEDWYSLCHQCGEKAIEEDDRLEESATRP